MNKWILFPLASLASVIVAGCGGTTTTARYQPPPASSNPPPRFEPITSEAPAAIATPVLVGGVGTGTYGDYAGAAIGVSSSPYFYQQPYYYRPYYYRYPYSYRYRYPAQYYTYYPGRYYRHYPYQYRPSNYQPYRYGSPGYGASRKYPGYRGGYRRAY